jgi:bifunctional non-homologous end joining protein LigD
MSLTKYKQKRSFHHTPEPTGGKPSTTKLEFVVQKHQASHLHYDFRLELRGVLISWAVPKGPQKDPAVKRLAMLVEDHPYDYRDFEGIIPEGNYGAGTVIVWDRGYYTPFDHKTGKVVKTTKTEMEKQMTKDFHAGQVKIMMHGRKLKGKYALIRTKRGDDDSGRSWLLIKDRDEHASSKENPFNDKSVISGKTLEQLAKTKDAKQWKSNREAATTEPVRRKRVGIPKKVDEKATPAKRIPKVNPRRGRSHKIGFEWKGKQRSAAVTENEFGGQKTVAVSVPMTKDREQLFYYSWISDTELFWNDLPDKQKQEMAKAIAKVLVS